MEIKPKKITILPISNLELQEQPTVIPQLIQVETFNPNEENPLDSIITNELPKSVNIVQSTENLLEHCEPIPDIDKLKEKLNKLGIRFNTDPKVYQKRDYWLLICILYLALTRLYKYNPATVIVTDWLNPHSDSYVPSEKLVAETIEELDGNLSQEILDRIQAIADEAATRLEADTNLLNTKQDNLTAGDNISINGTTISAVDTTYQASDFDIKDLSDSTNLRQTWSGKQDELIAGNNIQINGTTISATDTIYDDTEVRELIDAVDQKVDSLDEFTCGTIVPTTTNFVEGTDYTIHEALQRTANLFEGYQGYIDDINELIPNQTTPQNQLADKAFVNSTVATNAANFRGNWNTWQAVPTVVSDYPEDYTGSKTPTNNDYLVIQDASGYNVSCDGQWRFIYIGDWTTDGKSGWNPAYRIGHAFTQAQQDAIDSGITSTKVSTYDGYATSIGALQTDKVDKIYTASKVYGTDSQGSQIGYTAGDGISFTNGLIINTRTSASWGNITGTLSNLTDLLAELDSCVTSEEVQSVGDVTAYVNSRIPVIDKTSDSSSSFAIDANKMYMFGTRSSLTITLNPGESGIVNEYMFQFTSGSIATTLIVPNTVVWLKEPDIQTGKKYAVSIENNLGIIGEWGNE